MRNAMQLKAKIKNIAVEKNVSPQLVLQNYMMERLLKRISISKYKNNFIIKGGLLISSMIGIDFRTTMDMDTTIKNLPLNEESIKDLFEQICAINADDNISFSLDRVEPIRKDDLYSGFRVHLLTALDPVSVPVKVDVTIGDAITPKEIDFEYKPMFSDEMILIKSYNLETLLAEKLETIISRSVQNTRPRDFYDIYILEKLFSDRIDFMLLARAIRATFSKRGTAKAIVDYSEILSEIVADGAMNERWIGYTKEYSYTTGISFKNTVASAMRILNKAVRIYSEK